MQSGRGAAAALSALLLLSGCTADDGVREPGAAITEDEAGSLARLLQRNYQRGGADFVVTAPYGEDVVLTLTGEVDFRRSYGRAELVTRFGDARPDETATVVFTPEQLWVDDERRPLVARGTAELVDVLAATVLALGRPAADVTAAFTDGDWTWQGQGSIDSRLTAVFTGPDGPTVAVDAADGLLLQYVTTLPGRSFEVTVTLAEHGRRTVELPAPGS